jgi:ABC-2 type transport system ATP-binding protein
MIEPTALADGTDAGVPSEAAAAAISLRGLTKRYGNVEALRGVDMAVERGRVYGFLGRNGAGKTTTLRIIMGISYATAGVVEILGQRVRGDDPAVRRRVGYVAQEQAFYGWMTPVRLGQFVRAFYPTWDDGEFRRLLGLLDIPTDRRIQTLSGGGHAKLALALALAHRPELLVLDEPTAGMDAVARREFLELVRTQAQRAGRTTLFSSHLIDEVELAADTIGIIDGGRMLWQGPTAALPRQVRRLRYRGPRELAPPPPALLAMPEHGVSVLEDRQDDDGRELMVRAPPEALEALAATAAPWEVTVPSLEDIFVALVRRPIVY